jgi:hypothetical protein
MQLNPASAREFSANNELSPLAAAESDGSLAGHLHVVGAEADGGKSLYGLRHFQTDAGIGKVENAHHGPPALASPVRPHGAASGGTWKALMAAEICPVFHQLLAEHPD